MKLDAMRFGTALGIVWGFGVLCLGVMAAAFNWGTPALQLLGSLYLGFAPTVAGILIGIIWGFADGFIGGFLIAWVYNKLVG
ncbi:MAG: bacteriophage holin [bacterium]|nr:bacteriophage holin [bacterium]